MEAEKEKLCCCIYTRMLCSQTARSIHGKFQKVFCASVCSCNTILSVGWENSEKVTDFKNKPWLGAPVVTCNERTINLVSRALEDIPHMCDQADMFALSIRTVHTNVHEVLRLKKKSLFKICPTTLDPLAKSPTSH